MKYGIQYVGNGVCSQDGKLFLQAKLVDILIRQIFSASVDLDTQCNSKTHNAIPSKTFEKQIKCVVSRIFCFLSK